ncbi:MAG: hypothetical protein IIA89_02030 [Chloroflexi bacterium]|nr:hypothetical protein [Chloroflexota bacterium]
MDLVRTGWARFERILAQGLIREKDELFSLGSMMADRVKWYERLSERMKEQTDKLSAWRRKGETPDEQFKRGRPESQQLEEQRKLREDFIEESAGKKRD